ncbi:MAG: MTAP family purine nucleoside phosphorylase, partial [Dehalococcoidia bacterium]|nr:MTAP family purine nucleoside phosphorylase [Dehalococcoidia bacterium]
GTLGQTRVAFLPRHGRGHRLMPAEVPSRANIYALKWLGVRRLISINAVGSLKEEIRPMDLVIPDQLIDRTQGRASTFFGEGVVVHVPFAEPFCGSLSRLLFQAANDVGARVHKGGACVVIEGPAFSTKAESYLYRSWGASLVGMTQLPEAKLAREAGLCYSSIAMVTDYDCWHESHESVTVDMILANMARTVDVTKNVIKRAIAGISPDKSCECEQALKYAIVTARDRIPLVRKKNLELLIGQYLK